MGKFRISVVEIDEETGDDARIVVDLTAPSEVLREFAGYAVMSAIGANSETGGGTHEASVPGKPAEDGNYGPGQPRRKRRTKAEIEAARAAEAAGNEMPAPDVNSALASGGSVTRISNGETVVQPAPVTAASEYRPFG